MREALAGREAAMSVPLSASSPPGCLFGSCSLAIGAPGGKQLHEMGDRAEPRVAVRPESATSSRVAAAMALPPAFPALDPGDERLASSRETWFEWHVGAAAHG
jgi:hypothetical protein